MNIKDKLNLFTLGENFKTSYDDFEKVYTIAHKQCDLAATIDEKGNVNFYRTNCYNSGSDWMNIDYAGFIELVKFCELLIKNE